jgi:hypothetical protein
MTFDELLSQVHDLLQHQGRLSYRALKRRFNLNDDDLEDLKAELIRAQRLATDEDGEVLVWTGRPERLPALGTAPSRAPLTYTPPTSRRRSALLSVRWKGSASRSRCSSPT